MQRKDVFSVLNDKNIIIPNTIIIDNGYIYNPTKDINKFIDLVNILLSNTKNKEVKEFIDYLLTVEKLIESNFFYLPASLSYHHTFMFGLINHSIDVYNLANMKEYFISHNEKINLDLLYTSCLFHDFYKYLDYEYDIKKKIFKRAKTAPSEKSYHLKKIYKVCIENKWFSLADIFYSHHGLPQWGSPEEPSNDTAKILFACDLYSAASLPN